MNHEGYKLHLRSRRLQGKSPMTLSSTKHGDRDGQSLDPERPGEHRHLVR